MTFFVFQTHNIRVDHFSSWNKADWKWWNVLEFFCQQISYFLSVFPLLVQMIWFSKFPNNLLSFRYSTRWFFRFFFFCLPHWRRNNFSPAGFLIQTKELRLCSLEFSPETRLSFRHFCVSSRELLRNLIHFILENKEMLTFGSQNAL